MTVTYNGTTAGSTSQNPPVLIAQAMAGSISNSPGLTAAKLWFYTSTNASTDLSDTSGGFSDGYGLGMRAGDVVICVQATAGSTLPITTVGTVGASSTAGAFLTTSVISSTGT